LGEATKGPALVVEGDVVHVGYDLLTDEAEDLTLFFEFELPREVGRARADGAEFTVWLAGYADTVH
jgi:hypothetical protein